VIHGPDVGVQWATRVNKAFAARKMIDFKATASKPALVQMSDEKGAYIVVPMELSARIGTSGHYHETGTFTFTLVKQAGLWKITSQVWTVLAKDVAQS